MIELYQNRLKESQRRLASLLNRNPASKTYGCFDRSFWLHRKTDFATSTAQLSTSTLAHFYKTPFEGNLFYQQPTTLHWICAAVRFTLELQHQDGSFDEWYPNERGWGGPTGYVCHTLLEVLDLVGDEIPSVLLHETERSLRKAAAHLGRRDEGDVLANHYAISILALKGIAKRLNDEQIMQSSERWMVRFRRLISEEGWSLEYDGCDLGYNLGTLNFFADLHKIHPSQDLIDYARKAFLFLSHFAYPDGSWAGSLGSRHTNHSYFFALEYWAHYVPEAHALLHHQRQAIADGIDLAPSDQEDHYLHYRLADSVKALTHFYSRPLSSQQLPYEKKEFRDVDFPHAGFRIEKRGSAILWVALRRGGAYRLYSLDSKKALCIDNGCLLQTNDKQLFTSLWQDSTALDGSLTVKGHLKKIFDKRFTPLTFLTFRMFCFFMASSMAAYWFKRWIRRSMITNQLSTLCSWSRTFEWDSSTLIVRDKLKWNPRVCPDVFFWGGDFHTRYVPQAQYFTQNEIFFEPRVFRISTFSSKNSVDVTSRINLETGDRLICAE
jgi:hypothetical protein